MEHSYAEKIFWHHHVVAEKALLLQETSLWSKVEHFWAFFRSGRAAQPNSDQGFLHFYLTASTDLCIQFLSVNIVLLILSIHVITQKYWGAWQLSVLDPAFEHYTPAVIDIVIWIVLSVLCLAFFLTFKYRPHWFGSLMLSSERVVWYEIGASILAIRLLTLIVRIAIMAIEKDKFFDGHVSEETAFGFMFVKMTIDAYQAYAFVILPFPQPWALGFTAIELIRQEIRLSTYAYLIGDEHKWIVRFIAILLMLIYVTILLVPSAYLEDSVRNRFKRNQLRRQSEDIKQEMVAFLSKDVRVPLQYMLHAIASIEFAELSSSSLQPLLNNIEEHTRTVNDVADDLLLLVRIQEKRYTSKLSRVDNLRALCDGLVKTVMQRRLAEKSDATLPSARPGAGATGVGTTPTAGFKRDCFVYTDVPTLNINVDEKCLLAVLRHLLMFITQGNLPQPSSVFSTFALDLSIELTVPLGVETSSEKRMLQVVLSGDAATTRDWSEQRKVHEATTAYICTSIAKVCGGTFTSKDFSYHLTLPCTLVQTQDEEIEIEPPDQDAPVKSVEEAAHMSEGESGCVSVATNIVSTGITHHHSVELSTSSHASDRAALVKKIEQSTDVQARYKRCKVCVIVEDSVLESVITSAMKILRLHEGMSVLHELQKGNYIPVAKLTFVTSYELCAELRLRQYTGLIVLFAGSINYLDDVQMSNLDYNLPLPASDRQLRLFLDWLIQKHDAAALKEAAQQAKEMENRQAPVERTTIRRRPSVHPQHAISSGGFLPAPPEGEVIFLDHWPLIRLIYDFIRYLSTLRVAFNSENWLFVTRLPPGCAESFAMWRWLNPSNSWRHHAGEQYLTTLTRTIFIVFGQFALLRLGMRTLLPTFLVSFTYFSLQYLYKYALRPCKVRLWIFWQIPNIALLVGSLASIFRGLEMLNREHHGLTLSEFLTTKFEPYVTGAEVIYSNVLMVAYSRLHFMYQSHPLNILGMAIFFTRHTQMLWTAMHHILSPQMLEFIQLLVVQMTVLNVTYLIHLEDTYRNEFKTAHAHILARAFLDQCLDICQQDIRKPLEFLLERQKELMQVAVHAGYIRAVKITPHFLSKLEPLHVSGALLAEMSQELTFIRHNILTVTATTAVNTPVDNLKSHYSLNSKQLHRAVAELISSLSSASGSGVNVKIYAEIDNKLAVVRVDWKNLSMILTNLVSAALRNIREFCLESPRHKDIVNYVKIKMVAIDSDVKVPFVHPRLMLVNVCDSSNAAAKSAALAKARDADPSNGSRQSHATSPAESTFSMSSPEERDHQTSQYGRSVCEQLVRTLTTEPVFQTIAVQSVLQTVQRFTFQYHLTPQTRRTQDYIQTETDLPYMTVQPTFKQYFENYERIMFPPVRSDSIQEEGEEAGTETVRGTDSTNKKVVYFTSILVAQRHEITRLTTQFDEAGWNLMVKYILNVPSMHSIGGADCVVIDHQLEAQEGVNVCDTVLKLRVCGFNGVIAVVLQQNLRDLDLIRDELSKSAAKVDLIITGSIKEQHITALTVALEKKTVKHLLFMNGN